MKILDLHVQGFRSLKDVTWKPGDLNIIIGPNGTGKSNLLRLLEMLSVSAQGRLGQFVQNAGGMQSLVWDGRSGGIAAYVRTSHPTEIPDLEPEVLSYELLLHRLGASNYEIAEERLRTDAETGEQAEASKIIERHLLSAHVLHTSGRSLSVHKTKILENETLLSQATGLFSPNQALADFRNQVAEWAVYHDMRVDQDAPVRAPAVARVEKRVAQDGQNLINVLHTLYTGDRDFKREVNLAMQAAFGDEFEELVFPPAADQRVQLRIRWKSLRSEQSAADLSDGTLRFLFLLAVLASPSAAPLIAIDEPETGLHPSMFPIIAEYAAEAAQRSQVILTTHSPAMLDAFKDTIPTTTVALWEGGQTVLRTLEGDTLEEWVKNYSLGKLFTSGELEQLAAGSL